MIVIIFENEEEFKDKHGIYAIANKINGMVYIGQTRQRFIKRYWHHQWKLKDNTHDNNHLRQAWNLYGEDAFVFMVIDNVDSDSVDEINYFEEKYVGCCKRMKYSYNILDEGGGRSGVHLTDEHKRKIGEKNKINMTGKKNIVMKQKIKMSKIRKGKHLNKKMLQAD